MASGAIVAGAVAFLFFFGPRPTPAYADIYSPLADAAGLLVPPPGSGKLRIGNALVNGQPFQYSIGHSRMRLDDVLTHYEQQLEVQMPGSRAPVSTATRVEGLGAGVVAGMAFAPLSQPSEFFDRLRRFAVTKRANDFGRFHLVSAYQQEGTVFIDFTPGDEARIDKLLPAAGEDAPGEDLPAVQRPDGLQRMLTIEHGEGLSWSRTMIYRARDSRVAVDDFRQAFNRAGWTSNPLTASAAVLHYSDGRRESFVGGAGNDHNGAVIVVYRRLTASDTQP